MVSVRDAIIKAMDEEMIRDETVFLLGEEVGRAGGKNGTSRGLWEKYGDKRCLDTPISEMGFTGMAVGAAYCGVRPICEYMTFNFALQSIDHIINSAAKTFYMSAGRINVPIVFRGPNGINKGVAAQHTQDFSSWFAQCPGLKVIAPFDSEDNKGLLKAAIRDDNPVVFLENEILYDISFPMTQEMLSADYVLPIGKAKIQRPGTQVTLVAYSMGVQLALDAAELLASEDISAEVINLRTLRPFDFETIKKSAIKTGRVITVETGWPFGNIGSEICAQLTESDAYEHLKAPVLRVTGVDVPTPYTLPLETFSFPDTEHVVTTAKKVLHWKKN